MRGKRRTGESAPAAVPAGFKSIIVDYFKKKKTVLLVFHFGSSLSGPIGLSSDIDIGLLYKDDIDPFELAYMKVELSSLLKREVDLVVLNGASPIIRMQILKKGRLLLAGSTKVYNKFYAETVSQYDDIKQIRKHGEKSILKGRIYA